MASSSGKSEGHCGDLGLLDCAVARDRSDASVSGAREVAAS